MKQKVVVTGAAGLVGQNLMFFLEKEGYDIIAISKGKENLMVLKRFHPNIKIVQADLSKNNKWESYFKGADFLITLHVQFFSKSKEPFVRNNVTAQRNVLRAAKKYKIKYIVHLSSSVVLSNANTDYKNTKKEQEEITLKCGIPYVIFRPKLLYGNFNKKHLEWISRFIKKSPIFPIPGNGKYIRQPLFVQDMCKIIVAALKIKPKNKIYNIISPEKIYYIDLVKLIRKTVGSHCIILPIPVPIFRLIMQIYCLFSKNSPFTPHQLDALKSCEVFPVWNWWDYFGVKYTPVEKGMKITHQSKYKNIFINRST